MENQKMPDGTCHGREPKDTGTSRSSENAGTYGAGDALGRGFTERQGISGSTKSDGKQEGRR